MKHVNNKETQKRIISTKKSFKKAQLTALKKHSNMKTTMNQNLPG